MAYVAAIPGNQCKGQTALGAPDHKLKCVKKYSLGQPVYTCAGWRRFYVNCPKVNTQCNPFSSAWVAARVVCYQGLF